MSGSFQFTNADNLPKHAHLRFLTTTVQPQKALCFVDYRRFGNWSIVTDWSADRGPDPVYEYDLFRQNILLNLDDRVFKKPICETLLNQKYFNGIGNYLRAEILYRAGIKPFEESLSILEKLAEQKSPDLLQLCHDIPLELMNKNVASPLYDKQSEEFQEYVKWFQCYYQPGMYSMKDHNKRMIWFDGNDPGPLAPKKEKPVLHIEKKKSGMKTKKTEVKYDISESNVNEDEKPKRAKKATVEPKILNPAIAIAKVKVKQETAVPIIDKDVKPKRTKKAAEELTRLEEPGITNKKVKIKQETVKPKIKEELIIVQPIIATRRSSRIKIK